MSSSSAAATSAVSSTVDEVGSLQQLLHAPLAFVQHALDARATRIVASFESQQRPLTAASIKQLQTQLAQSNWGVEAAVEAVLGLKEKRSDSKCKLAMVRSKATARLRRCKLANASGATNTARIPSLNDLSATRDVSHLRPNQLVRFRGMIQETFQPDFYAGLYQEQLQPQQANQKQEYSLSLIRTGKYRDVLHVDATSDPSHETMMERLSINVVPIPGESSWVNQSAKQLEAKSGHDLAKAPTTAVASNGAQASAKKKRGLDASSSEETADSTMADDSSSSAAAGTTTSENAVESTPQKKGKSDAAASSSSSSTAAAATTAEGSALPAEHGLEVIVTLYDALANPAAAATAAAASASSSSSSSAAAAAAVVPRSPLRVGDMFEFIGVLSLSPDLKSALEDADNNMDGMGAELWSHRRTQALRMHALAVRRIEPGFPFIADHNEQASLFTEQKNQLLQVLPQARASLLEYLTSIMGGDVLSAELLLLFLMQRLHTRGSGVSGRSMIGKLVVNLITPAAGAENTNGPVMFARRLHEALQLLMPRVAKVDVNIEALNAQTWQPKKNYDDESLDSNLLHLASPSLLLMDETNLTVGTLSSIGITNLRVLSKLISQAVLEYDFQYQSLDFPVEYASLIVSAGTGSILSQDGQQAIDVAIKIVSAASAASAAAVVATPSSEQLDYWRAYLLMSRANSFQIAPTLSHQIEEHFVALRKARPTVTNETTLHRILNIARLYCLSHGESELSTSARWLEVTQLFERLHERSTNHA